MSTKYVDIEQVQKRMSSRIRKNNFSKYLFLAATMFGLVVLAVLIVRVLTQGVTYINWDFITGHLSTAPERAGIMGAILGTAWLMLIVIPVTMLIGVGTAIYLELYAKKGKFQSFIATNISNLAGVPSIVYGLLGLTLFVRALEFGNVILAGGLTLSLLVLPIVIVASQEAIRAVPGHLSEASYGMGATKWQTVKKIVLPAALPGILTGSILALSRAIGETAPLTVLGIPALLIPFPGGLFDTFTALPMQIYYWTLDSSLVAEYAYLAAATIIVLLVLLFLLNSIAIIIRNKFQQRY
ncbi:phosphate ABC transporter permease PstA [Oceanobacillus kimchii]|uniref:Phosphate transport system permease protein PstA n=1 Tax=Oceanobacillus kimchii TaxID=746691 RepID=A0ABQ5TLX6_9BACI|nr:MULTISPECIES: phosphate ABC transporter permease PstA [Oceanobacillus]MBT2599599.1 phosphate ABC transporter permease PstA [Oceanobacillus sp. ISL-74]MCT1576785.1 phosphate ABC transporter permease PstA [Oceanobacillus kimchii]MCT2134855.1 phosphate ABC transporter permease PstA [Oceanobacillus kimchii]OEH56147.1 phosphate ABC transporter permease [Oceanobacillus sp. E9]GLO67824.1 phosphate ABC transporter, permease protein PstA [Oceanobacillus kimchii]